MIIDIPKTNQYFKSNIPSLIINKESKQEGYPLNNEKTKFYKNPQNIKFKLSNERNYTLEKQNLLNLQQNNLKMAQDIYMKNIQVELERQKQLDKIKQMEALQENYYFSYFKEELQQKINESYKKKLQNLNIENSMAKDEYQKDFLQLKKRNEELDEKIKQIEEREINLIETIQALNDEVNEYNDKILELNDELENNNELNEEEREEKNEELMNLMRERDSKDSIKKELEKKNPSVTSHIFDPVESIKGTARQTEEYDIKIDELTEQIEKEKQDKEIEQTKNILNKLKEKKQNLKQKNKLYSQLVNYVSEIGDEGLSKLEEKLFSPKSMTFLPKDIELIKLVQKLFNLNNIDDLLSRKAGDAVRKNKDKPQYLKVVELFKESLKNVELEPDTIEGLSKNITTKNYNEYLEDIDSIDNENFNTIREINQNIRKDILYFERNLTPKQKIILGL